MFDKAMRKSVEPYLEPGEDVLHLAIVQGKGMTGALVAGGVIGATALGAFRDRKGRDGAAAKDGGPAEDGGVELSSKMGLAITRRRLLIFKAGGAVTLKAKELLTAVPIGEVDSMVAGKAALTKPVTITVRGESFRVEAPKAANTDKLVSAFEEAKRGAAALR
jgi:hypothetical protein